MKKCDIIIPIYNAYDCLAPCIDSVIKNTDLENNRLILIDDKSPDKKVLPLLEKYANDKNIILLTNSKNKGFVGTVNKGMRYSKENDVLLLNSDTEVTENWLEKIKKCAYSEKQIATVTPLSNNATFASVPFCFEPNDIPDGLTLEEMAKKVENSALNLNLETPTGHGFCLYIKRTVLDEIGLFDEETYGRGYGEENDFCFRAIDAGYKNVICDNTYILHKESQSFSDAKTELIKQGLEALSKRYPNYKNRLDLWCQSKKVSIIGNNLCYEMGKNQDKPNVLFVIHDFVDIKNNIGGTSLHVFDIIRNLRNYFNFHVLTPEGSHFKLYSYWANIEEYSTIVYPKVTQISEYPFFNADYKKMVLEIIDKFNINIAHIHHLIGNYFDLFDALKERKIYTIITLHDYYSVCLRINKLYKNRIYCDNPTIEKCAECMENNDIDVKRSLNLIKKWRYYWHEYLKQCDYIICPSEAAKNEINRTYPDININVIEHGVDIKKKEYDFNITDGNSNVAFVGAIGIHKGSNILRELVKTRKSNFFNIHLFGKIDIPMNSHKNFINHGRYMREDLPELLKKNKIKVVCLFSTWPETYSYTLTEAVASGVPVIAFDFGAIAERIKKYNLGWTIPICSDVDSIIDKIKEIFDSPDEYRNVIKSINNYKIKTTKEMALEYKDIYLNNLVKVKNAKIDNEYVRSKIKDSNIEYGNVSYANYAWVFDTLKWKIISKFKFPKFIKKMMGREND